jgi:hypothetical protein
VRQLVIFDVEVVVAKMLTVAIICIMLWALLMANLDQ